MSTLVLPEPAAIGASSKSARRAHQLYVSGRAHADHERWPHAAQAYEQAAGLSGDSAYALAASSCLRPMGGRFEWRPRSQVWKRNTGSMWESDSITETVHGMPSA